MHVLFASVDELLWLRLQEIILQRVELRFKEQDLSAVADNPGYLKLVSESIAAVINRLAAFVTRVLAAIFVQPAEEGPFVFPMKVGCVDRDIAHIL